MPQDAETLRHVRDCIVDCDRKWQDSVAGMLLLNYYFRQRCDDRATLRNWSNVNQRRSTSVKDRETVTL